ncbi:MAG TPA: DUF4153 domain-containing protein [Bacteroidia bacterium]|jgi:hypothetical protein|nr:DUF4153 domain-containing protein [Bacteroidia bacterium]
MVKVPSLQSLAQETVSVIKRFPLSVLSAILLTFSFMWLTHEGWDLKDAEKFFLAKLSMCSALGLSLFIATALLSEAKGHSRNAKIIVQLITLGLIVAYYFTIDNYENFNLDSFTRFSLYIIATHLFVAFAAFTGPNRINGFWQFNKTLFLRGLLSGLYTCVLYGGIALAFWLLDDLLHISIIYTKYAYTWYFLSGILNTFIFLGGVPKDLTQLEADTSYPKGLKAFTQFVLLPLVTLYLLILYIYFAKIVIHWSLPKGYISYLVISFSIMGILSLLLIYPLRNMEENKWIKIFSRWFYVALYPLIVLLGVSIFHRISEYGITEHRYFILVLAIWLVFIAAYFLFGKKENIKIIPVTLFLLAIITSAGPLSAFSVSHHSQKNRLEKILTANGILVNNRIVKTNKAIPDTVSDDINSILRYMENAHTIDLLQPWFTQNLDSIHVDKWGYANKTDSIIAFMGYTTSYHNRHSSSYSSPDYELNSSISQYRSSTNVKGFDYYSSLSYSFYGFNDSTKMDTSGGENYFVADEDTLYIIPYRIGFKYALQKHNKTISVLELGKFATSLHSKYDTNGSYYTYVPPDKLYYSDTAEQVVYRFNFRLIDVRKTGSISYIYTMEGIVLSKHL